MANHFWSKFSWKCFSVIIFLIVCYQLRDLSNKVTFHQVTIKEPEVLETKIELDFCYLLNIKEDELSADHHYDKNRRENNQKNNKNDSCNPNKPFSVNSKRFQNQTVSFIIQHFKECKLENLIQLKNLSEIKEISPEVGFKLYSDHICVTRQFEIQITNGEASLEITAINNTQTFLILTSFTRRFKDDGQYKSIRRLIFKRTCKEIDNDSFGHICTETNKTIEIKGHFYTIKNLKSPYHTNCVDRKSKTQLDCYEDCVKKKKKYFSLSYSEKDNFTLNFDKLNEIKPIIDQCALDCNQPDCNYGYFSFRKVTTNNDSKSVILLRINKLGDKFIASPYYSKIKLSWFIITLFSLIFKINLYNQLCKLKSGYNRTESRNQRMQKSKNLILFLIVALIGFLIAVEFEKLAFNYGEQSKNVVYRPESIKERNVSKFY